MEEDQEEKRKKREGGRERKGSRLEEIEEIGRGVVACIYSKRGGDPNCE